MADDRSSRNRMLPFTLDVTKLNRLYGTQQNDIAGILKGGPSSPWKMPTVLSCQASGHTMALPAAGIKTGIACAN